MSNTFERKYNKYKTKYNEIVGGGPYEGPRCSVDILLIKLTTDPNGTPKYQFLVETKNGKNKLPGWVLMNQINNKPNDGDSPQFNELTKSKNTGFLSKIELVLTETVKDDNYIKLSLITNLKLISIKDIESRQLLARFVNGFSLLNSIDILRERLNANNTELGLGVFEQRPQVSEDGQRRLHVHRL